MLQCYFVKNEVHKTVFVDVINSPFKPSRVFSLSYSGHSFIDLPACVVMNVISLTLFDFLYYSIEFDRDCDFFAIAGVTKKIKVFEYGTVIKDAVDLHYPISEMTCNSKIR